MQGVSGGLGAEHFDGIMMQLLMAASWRVKHLEGYCPFNHAPSFQVRRWLPPPAGAPQGDVLMCVCHLKPPALACPCPPPHILPFRSITPAPACRHRAVLRLDWRGVG